MAETFVYAFEWDPTKAAENVAKHQVAFEIAATVLRDPLALTIFDSEHSEVEERWASVGRAEDGRLLVVIHTFEETSAVSATVRVVSAREATQRERENYESSPR
ncbi:MAG TPA: BrnT family toxin [Burkholderiales bacterium]|nr:BrnT family toxin [Burkholderiales bacterium]